MALDRSALPVESHFLDRGGRGRLVDVWLRTALSRSLGRIFAPMLAALHESRSRQAAEIIRRYRHLQHGLAPSERSANPEE
jgi:hypothetical protein